MKIEAIDESHLLVFLSHLSGDEDRLMTGNDYPSFLSHLSGDEAVCSKTNISNAFLSHLSGDEEELYLKKISYDKVWRAIYPILPSIFCLIITV